MQYSDPTSTALSSDDDYVNVCIEAVKEEEAEELPESVWVPCLLYDVVPLAPVARSGLRAWEPWFG